MKKIIIVTIIMYISNGLYSYCYDRYGNEISCTTGAITKRNTTHKTIFSTNDNNTYKESRRIWQHPPTYSSLESGYYSANPNPRHDDFGNRY